MNTPIAKITRPKPAGIYPRKRLFKLLDQGRKKPFTWVSAPAGSGKTTLAASWLDFRKMPCLWYQVDQGDGDLASFFYYIGLAAKKAAPVCKKPLPLLTPEYLQGIPVFTRRYFEELFNRLIGSNRLNRSNRFCIVLDNYQDAPQDSGFHEMISHALEAVPEGVQVVVLSRSSPPPQFAKLLANNRLLLMGWEEVRFTREESEKLLKAQGRGRTDKKTADLLYETSEGWAAGLVLMTEAARTKGISYPLNSERSREVVFNYFASEIFDKTDAEKRDFLLKTSYFPWMTAAAAAQITGNAKAGAILSALNRNHYFTDRRPHSRPVFQYHPLFKEFLQARAKTVFTRDELAEIQRSTAVILEQEGRIDEAAALFIGAKDHESLAGIIRAHAQSLVEQGRQNMLYEWLSCLSRDIVEKDSWLLYWSGICRMIHDPRDSRSLLEQAYSQFKAGAHMTGVFLSWASIIDTFVYEWGVFRPVDRWIEVLDELLRDGVGFPSPEVEVRVAAAMLSALTFRQHRRADLQKWADRVEQIVLASRNVQLRMAFGHKLVVYYLWIGDFSRISFILDQLRPAGGIKGCDPLTKQFWYVMNAMHSLWAADWKTCLESISDGLKNAEDSGIHQFDMYLLQHGVIGGLSFGDPAAAESFLEKMTQVRGMRLLDDALYHYLASSLAGYHCRLATALEHAKRSAAITDMTECHISQTLILINLGCNYFKLGFPDESARAFQRAMEIGGGMVSMDFLGSLCSAEMALHDGREQEVIAHLKKGMAIGARYGMLNSPLWNSTVMSGLCATALEHGIETEYVKKLIRIRHLAPPEGTAAVEHWPWPLKITTLGRLQVRKDEQQLAFAGKKKQLDLLKMLIALGGVSIREEQVADILWPGAEGDGAHNNFKMTLSRLRGMIGNDAILHDEGLYSLNSKMVRVDVRDFERLCDSATRLWESNESKDRISEAARLTNQALDLYQGHFLPEDASCAWTVSMRERLRNKFLRLTIGAGRHYEDKGKLKTAAGYYEKGLEADALREEFYQRLMICHQKLDQRGEAAAVYHRCCSELSALNILPSAKTVQIYESVK